MASTLRLRTTISPGQWQPWTQLRPLAWGEKSLHVVLMSPDEDERAFHGCHCPGDMAVRMRKFLATPRSWCVLHC